MMQLGNADAMRRVLLVINQCSSGLPYAWHATQRRGAIFTAAAGFPQASGTANASDVCSRSCSALSCSRM